MFRRHLLIGNLVMMFWLTNAFAGEQWTDYPDSGVQLGMGWNIANGSSIPAICIDGVEHIDKTQSSYTTIGQLYDKTQLIQGLKLSTNVQLKGIVGGATAKFSYVNSQNISSESLTVAVYSSVINGSHFVGVSGLEKEAFQNLAALDSQKPIQMIPEALNEAQTASAKIYTSQIKLKPEFEKLWKENKEKFYLVCGTHYIGAFREGAELIGFLKSSDLSLSEQSGIDAALSGNYFGQSASSDFSKTLSTINNVKALNIEARKSGGWGSSQVTDKESLLKAISDLAKDAANNPITFQILPMPYSSLMHEPATDNPDDVVLDKLLTQYWRFATLHNSFLDVDSKRSDYIFNWGISGADFDKALTGVQDTLGIIRNKIKTCYQNKKCQQDNQLPTTFDYRTLLPIKKNSFAADIELHNTATAAQSAVAKYNNDRTVIMTYVNFPFWGGGCGSYYGNHYFCSWSEPTWLNTIWPKINTFNANLAAYPLALKARTIETRLEGPWRQYCRPTAEDMDCISLYDLRLREDRVFVPARTSTCNGTGVFPGGEATRCGSGIHAVFNPNID